MRSISRLVIVAALALAAPGCTRATPAADVRVYVDGADCAALGDTVVVRMDTVDLGKLQAAAKPPTKRPWGLYLGDRFVSGVVPDVRVAPIKSKDTNDKDVTRIPVRFPLHLDKDSRALWSDLFRCSPFGKSSVNVAVGAPDGDMAEIPDQNGATPSICVSPLTGPSFWAWLAGSIAVAAAALWVVLATRAVRDRGDAPAGGAKPTYSLARTQIAFWTVLGALGFLYLWAVTGDVNVFSSEVVTLMGLSAATALGGVAVDASKTAADKERKDKLTKQVADLTAQTNANPAPANVDALRAELAAAQADLSKVPPSTRPTVGVLQDLLSDANGAALHRLQLLVWNAVLGVLFVSEVVTRFQMPQFNSTLLSLVGISGGTYLGFKWKEPE